MIKGKFDIALCKMALPHIKLFPWTQLPRLAEASEVIPGSY